MGAGGVLSYLLLIPLMLRGDVPLDAQTPNVDHLADRGAGHLGQREIVTWREANHARDTSGSPRLIGGGRHDCLRRIGPDAGVVVVVHKRP